MGLGLGMAVYGASEKATGTAYGVLGYSQSPEGYGGFFQNLAGGAAGLFSGSVRIEDGSDVAPAGGSYLQIGPSGARNIGVDGNEIMARNDGSTASLTLNANGGDVRLFPDGTGQLEIGSDLEIREDEIAGVAGLFSVRGSGAMLVEGGTTVDIEAGAGMTLDSGSTLDLSTSLMTLSGTSQVDVTSPLINTTGYINHVGDAVITGNLTITGTMLSGGCAGPCAIVAPSDARWKEQVETLVGALDTVTRLRGKTYRWNDDAPLDDSDLQYGFIAQEVAEVLPDIVKDHPDGEHYTVAYHQVIPILTEALRELRAEKDAELDALRARVDALEQELARSHDVTRELVTRFERAMASVDREGDD